MTVLASVGRRGRGETLAYGANVDAHDTIVSSGPAFSVTESGYPPETMVAPQAPHVPIVEAARATRSQASTVLPRLTWDGDGNALLAEARPRFERVRPLGEGAMGEVTLMHDHDIDRDVAIKRLQPRYADPVSLVRFAEEVRAVGKLEHPNIAPVHDVGIDEDGQPYFLMKYVQGETVEAILERLAAGDAEYAARFSFEARVDIFRGVLRALECAHAQGIIHRDVKPANVMVGPFGEVVLMDWGIAKHIPRNDAERSPASSRPRPGNEAPGAFGTRQGNLVGTPAYMSPEQARGDNSRVDERSDIYSACVMLYELMTLEHPLSDLRSVDEVLRAISAYQPSSLEMMRVASRTGAPLQYLHVARHGMANDPANRFQRVGEILARLQENDDGRTRVECPLTLVKRVGGAVARWVDRHPIAATGGMIAGCGAALAGLAVAAASIVPWILH